MSVQSWVLLPYSHSRLLSVSGGGGWDENDFKLLHMHMRRPPPRCLLFRSSVCVDVLCHTRTLSHTGAAIGIGLAELYQTPLAQLVCGSLQAIACGTFLYVTFFEVLPHEMNSGGNRLAKVLCIILGFSFIAVMMLLLPEHED